MIYYERQNADNISKIFSLIVTVIFSILTIYIDCMFLSGVAIFMIFGLILQIIRLDIAVYKDRIEYKCIPFHRSSIKIRFDEVKYIEVKSIEHNGFYSGFRIKHTCKYSLYMFGGYDVIKIYRYNKPDIILTTQKLKDLRQVLINYDINRVKGDGSF